MAGGMLIGFAALSAFNAVDTYFVGQLGTFQLAAMSFTFPVVMFLNSIALGLGVGVSSVVSRSIGAGDHHKVQRFVTDGLLLGLCIVFFLSILGLLTVNPLFRLLGAEGQTLEYINEYMTIWYLGQVFVVIPMLGNNAIRATGDTLIPSLTMLVSFTVNLILDPLLIFGIGPFPAFGITGAAIATVIARFTSFVFSLSILRFREKLIVFERVSWREIKESWSQIIFVGIPAALVQIVNPLSLGVITRLLAKYGEETVAGFGAASRVEMVILIIPMAFATVMAPFSGQNWGAKKIGRILAGLQFSSTIVLLWGGVVFVILLFFGESIAGLFTSNPRIIQAGSSYLRIVSISYGFFGILVMSSQSFSAMNRPLQSAGITLLRSVILYLPLALTFSRFWQETGIFISALAANILGGGIGGAFLYRMLTRERDSQAA